MHLGVHWRILGGGEVGVKVGTVFFGLYPYQKQGKKSDCISNYSIAKLCLSEKKNLGQHSALFLTTTSTKDFSWSPDSAAAKIPIIVRGACNTGYFDGHNTQN